VKPYGSVEKGTGWLAEGRVVRRGEKGVKGLFHISQTDPVPAKPEMTPERRGMFKKAAAKAKASSPASPEQGRSETRGIIHEHPFRPDGRCDRLPATPYRAGHRRA